MNSAIFAGGDVIDCFSCLARQLPDKPLKTWPDPKKADIQAFQCPWDERDPRKLTNRPEQWCCSPHGGEGCRTRHDRLANSLRVKPRHQKLEE